MFITSAVSLAHKGFTTNKGESMRHAQHDNLNEQFTPSPAVEVLKSVVANCQECCNKYAPQNVTRQSVPVRAETQSYSLVA